MTWNPLLRDQLDWHWTNQLRPRLDGLTDDEYHWAPTSLAGPVWGVRPRGTSTAPMQAGSGDYTIDWGMPEEGAAREPFTTIAWRMGHVIVGCLAMRNHSHFGAPAGDYFTWDYAGTAAEALAQLDEQVRVWRDGVAGLGEEGLARPCGEAEGPYAQDPLGRLVLHINRELIHHGAEISMMRDLYAHMH
ncbi:DinB family protein [Actinomycetota bacterium]